MFSKNKDKDASARPTRNRANGPVSLISPDLTVTGNLSTQGDLQIDGTVEGNIQCQSLTIGAAARVIGHISAFDVLVRGSHKGDIEAHTITLTKTARVTGDIKYQTIASEAGASLDGRLTSARNRPAETAEPSVAPTVPIEVLGADPLDQIQRIRRQIK